MPSRAWVVTIQTDVPTLLSLFQCPLGLELLRLSIIRFLITTMFQCPLGLELLPLSTVIVLKTVEFQCPLGLELLLKFVPAHTLPPMFQCPLGLELLRKFWKLFHKIFKFQCPLGLELLRYKCHRAKDQGICFNALSGLSCYGKNVQYFKFFMMLFMHTCYL